MVERPLRMRQVPELIPGFSKLYQFVIGYYYFSHCNNLKRALKLKMFRSVL